MDSSSDSTPVKQEGASNGAANGSAGSASGNGNGNGGVVDEARLRQRLETLVKEIDLDNETAKTVRQRLEKEFGCDLSSHKKFIGRALDEIITGGSDGVGDDGVAEEKKEQVKKEKVKKEKKEKVKKEKKEKKESKKGSKKASKKAKEEEEEEDEEDDDTESADRKLAEQIAVEEGSYRPRRRVAQAILDKSEARRKKEIRAAERRSTREKKPPKPMWLSPALRSFLGVEEASRGEVVKMVWDYIKKHELQNPANKREILCDANMQEIFGKKVTMFSMNKVLSKHIKRPDQM